MTAGGNGPLRLSGLSAVLAFANRPQGSRGDAQGLRPGIPLPAGTEIADPVRPGLAGVVEPVGDAVLDIAGGIAAQRFQQRGAGGGVLLQRTDMLAPDAARPGALDGEAPDVRVGVMDPTLQQGDGLFDVRGDGRADRKPRPFPDAEMPVGGESAHRVEPIAEAGFRAAAPGREGGPTPDRVR